MLPLEALRTFITNPEVDLEDQQALLELYQIQKLAEKTINIHQPLLARIGAIFTDRSLSARIALLTVLAGSVAALWIESSSKEKNCKALMAISAACGASMAANVVFDLKEMGEAIQAKLPLVIERVREIFFNRVQ